MKYIPIILLSFLMACTKSEPKEKPEKESLPKKIVNQETLPPISAEIFRQLVDSLSYLDVIIYNSDFTMNVNTPQGIQAFLSTFDTQAPNLNPACRPIGRIFLEHEGQELLQADLFYQKECVYYLFYENGKKKFANKINPRGIQYFNQIFKQANSPQLMLQ